MADSDSEGESIGDDSPPPSREELRGLSAGRHPDLFPEEQELLRAIGRLHCFDTAVLAVNAVGSAQVLSAQLAMWGYPRDVPSPTLRSEVRSLSRLDEAYKSMLAVLTPAITRLLAVEYLIMRRAVALNSEFHAASEQLSEQRAQSSLPPGARRA